MYANLDNDWCVPRSWRSVQLALLLAILATAGCALLPEPAEEEPAPPAEPAPAPEPEVEVEPRPPEPRPEPPDTTTRPASPGLLVAREDDAPELRSQWLLERGGEVVQADSAGYYLDVLYARLRQTLAGHPVALERGGREIVLTFPGLATFETASSELSSSMHAVLDEVAGILVEFNATLVTAEGHTDDQGPREVNQRLSEARALAVARYLRAGGVGADRLVARGFGPDYPITGNETPDGRASNRRVELVIQPLVLEPVPAEAVDSEDD